MDSLSYWKGAPYLGPSPQPMLFGERRYLGRSHLCCLIVNDWNRDEPLGMYKGLVSLWLFTIFTIHCAFVTPTISPSDPHHGYLENRRRRRV
jgi:hypothetical protein